MGSATREALASSKKALSDLGTTDLTTVREIFAAGRVVGDSGAAAVAPRGPVRRELAPRRRSSTVSSARDSAHRLSVCSRSSSERAGRTPTTFSAVSRSSACGPRLSPPVPDARLEAQLFSFGQVVSSDSELELALGSKLGAQDAKTALVEKLLTRQGLTRKPSRSSSTSCCSLAAAASVNCFATRHPSSLTRTASSSQRSPVLPLSDPPSSNASRKASPRSTGGQSGSTRLSTPPSSEACVCRSATTSSTAASPRASANSDFSLLANASTT